jgi:hypothetical protein
VEAPTRVLKGVELLARLAILVPPMRDGGRTWDVLRRGLPQEHAYDIVYRHALDVDETGDRLAFGSTTGRCG